MVDHPVRLIWGLLLFSYCALIFYLSSQPMLPLPDIFRWQDKLIHAAAYAVMAVLFWQTAMAGTCRGRFTPLQSMFFTLLFCALYGASDEWHQSFVAGRNASLLDWIADLSGALLLTLTLFRSEVRVLRRE